MKFKLDHVAIRCADYEKSKKCVELLGAKVIFESTSKLDGCPYSLVYIGGEDLKVISSMITMLFLPWKRLSFGTTG